MEEPILNAHNKDEFAPSHIGKQLLNSSEAKTMKKYLLTFSAAMAVFLASVSCKNAVPLTITPEESALINASADTMRILTVNNEADLSVLRDTSRDFSIRDLCAPEYAALARKMVRTLESCEGGVGLAAPQVGINRRVVAVMRIDKEGEPIEVYPNLRIVRMRGDKEPGDEGCLSIPDRYGKVMRYRHITIVYTDISSALGDEPREIREDIDGFTAIIFQHEADHLDGVLYTDRL